MSRSARKIFEIRAESSRAAIESTYFIRAICLAFKTLSNFWRIRRSRRETAENPYRRNRFRLVIIIAYRNILSNILENFL